MTGRPRRLRGEDVMVPLVKLGVLLFVACAIGVTVLQCASVYRHRDAAVAPKLCLAAELSNASFPSWLHESALLGAVRLRSMLTLEPVFDVAVLASVDAVNRFVHHLEGQCKMPLMSTRDQWEWSVYSSGAIFRITRFEETEGDSTSLIHKGPSGSTEELVRGDVLPAIPCDVGRALFKCPRDHHAFLAKAFGPLWSSAPLVTLLS